MVSWIGDTGARRNVIVVGAERATCYGRRNRTGSHRTLFEYFPLDVIIHVPQIFPAHTIQSLRRRTSLIYYTPVAGRVSKANCIVVASVSYNKQTNLVVNAQKRAKIWRRKAGEKIPEVKRCGPTVFMRCRRGWRNILVTQLVLVSLLYLPRRTYAHPLAPTIISPQSAGPLKRCCYYYYRYYDCYYITGGGKRWRAREQLHSIRASRGRYPAVRRQSAASDISFLLFFRLCVRTLRPSDR